MSDSEKVIIGTFLKRIHRPIKLEKDKEYKLVTIKMHHKGLSLRCVKKGSEIQSQMHLVKKGDFILSGIDARNGAFGIIPPELDGAIVTNDFWIFDIDEKIIKKNLFLELTQTSWFDEICRKGSGGITQRIRLQKDKFFNQKIHLPQRTNQESLLKKITGVKASHQKLLIELTRQQNLLKKFRQSILRDAISGKLTEQWRKENSAVEPASELLKRIKAEKDRLVKEKKIPKQKPLPPITDDEIPFELPEGWVWCRLGEITSKIGSGSTPRGGKESYVEDGILFLRSQNIHNDGLKLDDVALISQKTHDEMANTKVKPYDVLLNITGGSIGRAAQIPESFDTANVSQHVCIIRPILFDSKFLHNLVLSSFFQQLILKSVTGAGREGLPKNKLEQLIISVPPESEIFQINNKVYEAFQACEKLDFQLIKSQLTSELLMQSVLKEAFER
jgi:type I restriction enzyme S subunit